MLFTWLKRRSNLGVAKTSFGCSKKDSQSILRIYTYIYTYKDLYND